MKKQENLEGCDFVLPENKIRIKESKISEQR